MSKFSDISRARNKGSIFAPLTDGKVHPVKHTFNVANNTSGTETIELGNREALLSLSIYINQDNKGVLLVNPYIYEGKYKRYLQEAKGLFDGSGFNAKRFNWVGYIPLSELKTNTLYIDWANYSGSAINDIKVIGDTK